MKIHSYNLFEIKKYFSKPIYLLIFCGLLLVLILTRFSFPETKSGFGFDQVDNAWAVKNIVVDRNFPMVGMQAKGNTGFYIGPYYYYFLVPFYLSTGLDPIASNLVAGITAVFTLFVTYFVTKGIFNEKVALFAVFITSVSSYIFELDRVQWPVNFIVPLSFLVFYSLYKPTRGEAKFFLLLAVAFGFSLHVHFTSVFYILLIAFASPFIPRTRQTLKYVLYSLIILLFFLFPIIITYLQTKVGGSAAGYLGSSFHGFHLRRFMQIIGDGFIEFNSLLNFKYSLFVSISAFISFIFLLIRGKKTKRKSILIYLSILWILVPWVAFSTYSGEITNYYFAITRPVAILVFAYLLYRLFALKLLVIKLLVLLIMSIYAYSNLSHFFKMGPVGLASHRKAVLESIEKGEKIEFVHGNPQSYLYYYYKEIKNEK